MARFHRLKEINGIDHFENGDRWNYKWKKGVFVRLGGFGRGDSDFVEKKG